MSADMSTIDITGWAPDRSKAIAFLEARGIAATDKNGNIYPLVEAHIHPCRPGETIAVVTTPAVFDQTGKVLSAAVLVPGWHFNIRFYGESADKMLVSEPVRDADVIQRTTLIDEKTKPLAWVAVASDPIPPGYQSVDGVRLFDPALISTQRNEWA